MVKFNSSRFLLQRSLLLFLSTTAVIMIPSSVAIAAGFVVPAADATVVVAAGQRRWGTALRRRTGSSFAGSVTCALVGSSSSARSRTSSSSRSSSLVVLRGGGGGAPASSSPGSSSSFPLKQWIGQGVACALSYALYNLFIKKASTCTKLDPILGGVLLQFVAALLGSALYGYNTVFNRGTKATVSASVSSSSLPLSSGIAWSAAAGIAVGAAEILSFVIGSKGVQASQSVPLVVGGSVLLGTLLGRLWLKETLGPKAWFGVALIAIGIAFVGADSTGTGH